LIGKTLRAALPEASAETRDNRTMCGRYELHTHSLVIALAVGLKVPSDITTRYNIAPTTGADRSATRQGA
jgi:hypothetical protein